MWLVDSWWGNSSSAGLQRPLHSPWICAIWQLRPCWPQTRIQEEGAALVTMSSRSPSVWERKDAGGQVFEVKDSWLVKWYAFSASVCILYIALLLASFTWWLIHVELDRVCVCSWLAIAWCLNIIAGFELHWDLAGNAGLSTTCTHVGSFTSSYKGFLFASDLLLLAA